jgi:hypothetical protein
MRRVRSTAPNVDTRGRADPAETDGEGMADGDMGPVDHVVVEFPANNMNGEGFPDVAILADEFAAAPFVADIPGGGAPLVAGGRLPADTVMSTLELAHAGGNYVMPGILRSIARTVVAIAARAVSDNPVRIVA